MKVNVTSIYIICAFCIMASLASCKGRHNIFTTGMVAQVGDKVLTEDDIKITFPEGTSSEDSLSMVQTYVDLWVRKQLKIQEAEKVLEKSGIDFDAMVADYRNSLLTHQLDKYYVERSVDTLISDDLVKEYYNEHNSEFKLDRNIIKGRIIKFPDSFRQQNKLKELMGSANLERQQDFIDMASKNDFPLTVFDEWIGLDEMLNYLPTVRSKNYDYLLSAGTVNEFADDDFKYYVQISEYKSKGEKAPLEWSNVIIQNMLYNQRSGKLIKAKEDSLYRAALDNKHVKIYLQTNND